MNPSSDPSTHPQPASGFPEQVPPPARQVTLALPSHQPWVTYTIIGVTVLVYLIQVLTLRTLGVDLPEQWGIKANELIRAGQLWRLFTPMLLHDDMNIAHIGFNMYFLYIVGTRVERMTGHGRYLVLYILSGFAGDALSFLASPYNAWGASGALFGLLGYEAALAILNRSLFKDGGRRMLREALFVAAINILIGYFIGADNWGHVGGLLGGLIFTWFAGPRWQVEGIAPSLHLVDKREPHEVLTGAALVALVFGALVMIGMIHPLVQ